MNRQEKTAAALGVFALYGFRKTSMDDVANAIGVSRQALYKKYSSKEALFHSLVEDLVTSNKILALDALQDKAMPVAERILTALDLWAGQYVELLRASPHSSEVFDIATAEVSEVAHAAESEITDAIAGLMGRRSARTKDAAFALAIASKGLMTKAQSRDEYRAGMKRVISAVVGA